MFFSVTILPFYFSYGISGL